MKLIINGAVKPYYVQMLVMLWFPGEKFSPSDGGERSMTVTVGADYAEVECVTELGGGCVRETAREGDKPELTVGRAIYRLFGDMTGFYPEWGILTGVRPSKLATASLRKGADRTQAQRFLTDTYNVSPEKAALAVKTAAAEMRLIDSLPENSCSLYVSIPFCPTRCEYCSFVSYATPRLLSMIPDYLTRLTADLKELAGAIKRAGKRIVTVYIGGGTPTILTPEQLECLLEAVNLCLIETGSENPREFTLEGGRPDTITAEKLSAAKAGGVTRLSVNPQTTNDEVLAAIGRSHSAGDFFAAYAKAVHSGIKYINCDLIAGLPRDNLESFQKSVSEVVALNPANITVHSFTVKKSAEIREHDPDIYSRNGIMSSARLDEIKAEVSGAYKTLGESGYAPYYLYRQKNTAGALDNVGYSKAGAEGLYNIFIMEEVHDIFAVGAGAVTKLLKTGTDGKAVIERIFAPKYPYEYLDDEKFDIKEMTKKTDNFYADKS